MHANVGLYILIPAREKAMALTPDIITGVEKFLLRGGSLDQDTSVHRVSMTLVPLLLPLKVGKCPTRDEPVVDNSVLFRLTQLSDLLSKNTRGPALGKEWDTRT